MAMVRSQTGDIWCCLLLETLGPICSSPELFC